MKARIIKILSFIAALLVPVLVIAQSYGLKTAADTSGLSSNVISQTRDIPTILGTLIGVALSLVGVYFFILILYAGVIWMTAAGASDKVEMAKKKMTSAVIGLVIVLSAYALTRFVFDTFLQESREPTGADYCKTAVDGSVCKTTECSSNCACKGAKCISECDYNFKDYGGKCGDKSKCAGRLLSGLCPGGKDNKCCVSVEGYAQWQAGQQGTSEAVSLPQGAGEQNACEADGNFCSTKAACETTYNGKSLGENGCGAGEICCKSCANIGGKCIDTELYECANSDKNQKSGYCYGAFVDAKYKCCIGPYEISSKYFNQ